MENPQKLSDKKLFHLCREFGSNAQKWRRRFEGLLPEVMRRKLYEKKKFGSIFEFAGKLAGMSHKQVSRVLQLDRKFEDKPVLQALLVKGEVSVNKLARVASIATVENQEDLAKLTKIMSNRAIETFVRDEKRAMDQGFQVEGFQGAGMHSERFQAGLEFENQDGLSEPKNDLKSVHVHSLAEAHVSHQSILPFVKILEKLSPEIKEKLLELINKEIDLNGLIAQMLQNREAEIAAAKSEIAEENKAQDVSRYIPVKIKKIIKLEQGTKCSYPGCKNRAENIHHTQRFSITKNHNPFFLANACRPHHEIAHIIDRKYQEKKSGSG